jgi:hypothetical protein
VLKEDNGFAGLSRVVLAMRNAVEREDVSIICHYVVSLSRVALRPNNLVSGQVVSWINLGRSN